VAIAAVARGAAMIEKHLTLDCSRPGPDHVASLDPGGFGAMVRAIRRVERAFGNGVKAPQSAEISNIPVARKSIVAACAIRKGEAFSADNMVCKRPGGGLSPALWWDIQGQIANRDFAPDQAIEL
jgi:sialic acid synthase SpsE